MPVLDEGRLRDYVLDRESTNDVLPYLKRNKVSAITIRAVAGSQVILPRIEPCLKGFEPLYFENWDFYIYLNKMMGSSVIYGALLLTLSACYVSTIEHFNVSHSAELVSAVINGKTKWIPERLLQRLQEEEEKWHWIPWQRTRLEHDDDIVREYVQRDSIDSFPDGLLTEDQLRNGGVILYVMFGIYAFTLLAVICNDYFIPCVELICEDLKIPQNVAAATFMAVATSCPEFFVNVISTFITESDMGIGTIVGSAIFNALGVAAIGGLAAIRPIAIGMRPVTRDVVIYMVNVAVLVGIVWDGQVDWYEAVVLGILYILYFVLMFNSVRLFHLYDKLLARCTSKRSVGDADIVVVPGNVVEEGVDNRGFTDPIVVSPVPTEKIPQVPEKVEPSEPKQQKSIFAYPKHKSVLYQLGWVYLWPIKLLFRLTIPSPTYCRRWYPLAFFMCIVWIGVNSYFVSWSMSVIGHVLTIPDSVMGMTFLAFGGCLPEAFSIFIMSRRGEGGIGVSNALGANSLAILFALGIPWLIRTLANIAQGAEETAVFINSTGIDFVVGSLLLAVTCLWLTLFIAKFMLRKSVGYVLSVLYLIFITFAVLVETGVILDRCTLGDC